MHGFVHFFPYIYKGRRKLRPHRTQNLMRTLSTGGNSLNWIKLQKMSVAAPLKFILGSIAFAIFWMLAVFPAVPFLPIGRTAGSLLGAMLMVIFQVITPDDAYSAVNLPILGLLFGTMVVSIYLEKEDMFKYLGKLLSWKCKGPKDLISRVCLISAISSALFTNDTSCVVLTEFVLRIARQHNLPPHPFLLALASSANIGSAATPIGNPQNLVIAVQSKISFGSFLFGLLPSMLVGVFINGLMIICMYWKALSIKKRDETDLAVGVDDMDSHRFSPTTLSHLSSPNLTENGTISSFNDDIERAQNTEIVSARNSNEGVITASVRNEPFEERFWSIKRWKWAFWKACVYGVALGMLISLLLGMDMSWTAITAALALVVIDFKDARTSLEKVSYSLLIFFCGMFITVEGFNKTGIPGALWDLLEPYSQIDHVSGIAVLALVILFLSNFASNVPTVLLLGGRVAASAAAISEADGKKAWLILAWVSTVGGNLSLLGSAANLIVCEQARNTNTHLAYNLSFWRHLKFGLPSTLIVTAIGLAILR